MTAAQPHGSGWRATASQRIRSAGEPARPDPATAGSEPLTTVLPEGRVRRPGPPRPTQTRTGDRAAGRPPAGRTRKARLALKRIDPWSVFLFSLLASVFAGIALVVAIAVLYAILNGLGVVASVNELVGEVTGNGDPLFTTTRFVGGAVVLAAVNVVLLTLLATLSALLYNLCASFTGGIAVTLGERDG